MEESKFIDEFEPYEEVKESVELLEDLQTTYMPKPYQKPKSSLTAKLDEMPDKPSLKKLARKMNLLK